MFNIAIIIYSLLSLISVISCCFSVRKLYKRKTFVEIETMLNLCSAFILGFFVFLLSNGFQYFKNQMFLIFFVYLIIVLVTYDIKVLFYIIRKKARYDVSLDILVLSALYFILSLVFMKNIGVNYYQILLYISIANIIASLAISSIKKRE